MTALAPKKLYRALESRNPEERKFAQFCQKNGLDKVIERSKRKFGNKTDQDDFEGKLLLAVWEQIDVIYHLPSPQSYVAGMARNLMREVFRKNYRRREFFGYHIIIDDYMEQGNFIPEDLESRNDEQRTAIFFQALAKEAGIDDQNLQILIAFYIDNKTSEQIAQEHGIPAGTVRSRLYRMRQQIEARGLLHFEELMFVLNNKRRIQEFLEDFGVKIPLGNIN